MSKENHLKPEVIQKFKRGVISKEWKDDKDKLSSQFETMEVINNLVEQQDCGSEIKTPPSGGNK